MPTISIIMTVYNRERYVGDAIASVLAQTYHDFELLVWDDGSTDGSVDIAYQYAKGDSRVKVVAAPHQGRVLALYSCHATAIGKYICWLDSDDLLAPTALKETSSVLLNSPDIGLVYTNYVVIDEHDVVKGLGSRCRIPYSKDRLLVDFMTFHFRLMRRDAFELAGGIDTSTQVAIDYDLCLRLSEVTQVAHVAKELYYYRTHFETISHRQRVEQILAAQSAIARALVRRSLSDRYEINVEIVGQFFLRRKADTQSFHP
jgi:glycosyltransferase involved in cell wall biosynthesis